MVSNIGDLRPDDGDGAARAVQPHAARRCWSVRSRSGRSSRTVASPCGRCSRSACTFDHRFMDGYQGGKMADLMRAYMTDPEQYEGKLPQAGAARRSALRPADEAHLTAGIRRRRADTSSNRASTACRVRSTRSALDAARARAARATALAKVEQSRSSRPLPRGGGRRRPTSRERRRAPRRRPRSSTRPIAGPSADLDLVRFDVELLARDARAPRRRCRPRRRASPRCTAATTRRRGATMQHRHAVRRDDPDAASAAAR